MFDLEGEQSFSDSLLDCLFHGLKQYVKKNYPQNSDEELAKSELKLAVEFNNLPMLVRAFEVAHCRQCSIQTVTWLCGDRSDWFARIARKRSSCAS